MRKAKRCGGSSTRLGRRSPIILAAALLACVTIVITLASNAIGFAMYRVGDAFVAWTGVELNGKLYPPNAGDGPSWKFWVDPDVGPGKPEGYPKPGEPQCDGTADLNIRSVSGEGLYVTDSGFLVQVIDVAGQWVDTSYQVKCYGNNWCSRPCGEEIGDAWIYVALDVKKLKGGMPIYVEVSDETVEDWIKFAESETKVIQKLKWEAEQGDQNAVQIRWLGHVEGGELQQEVPFLWFPDNATLKFKLTGLMKVMHDYGALYKHIHYYVYIAPPEGQMFKVVKYVSTLKTRRTRTRCPECLFWVGGKCEWKLEGRAIVRRYTSGTPPLYRCIYTKKVTSYGYKLIQAESTPQPVTTTLTQIEMTGDTLTAKTLTTTMTVNKLVEKTVNFEKTTTVTVKAPKTTYLITNSEQAKQVAAAYKPPKPLTQVIYEKLMEFYNWLLTVLGLR